MTPEDPTRMVGAVRGLEAEMTSEGVLLLGGRPGQAVTG
jgi:hypothetical protein